jgi:hypothetical protein
MGLQNAECGMQNEKMAEAPSAPSSSGDSMLDPYHRWLAIPKDRRPPTHYQLLGVAPDEADPEVINEAALRQASHVRTYQAGPHADVCTRLLTEIAQARKTLLNPEKRREYDAQLAAPPTPPALPVVEVEPVAWPPKPRKRAPFDGRDGLMLLFGAACMLIAQLVVWGAVRLLVALLRPRESQSEPE